MKNQTTVTKPWGKFERFTLNEESTVKLITVEANEKLSLQSHEQRAEFWRVVSGNGYFTLDGVRSFAEVGTECRIPYGAQHRMEGGNSGMVVLEIAFGHFDEEDITRYEDSYGRAGESHK